MGGREYPGINIGPEPTTDRFVVVEHGLEDRRTPGNTLVVQPNKPYQVRDFCNYTLPDSSGILWIQPRINPARCEAFATRSYQIRPTFWWSSPVNPTRCRVSLTPARQ